MIFFNFYRFILLFFCSFSLNLCSQGLPEQIRIKKEFFGFLRWWHGDRLLRITNTTGTANAPIKHQKELLDLKEKFGANYAKYAISIKKGLLVDAIEISGFLNSYLQPAAVGAMGIGLPTNAHAQTSTTNPYRHILSDYYTPSFFTKIAAIFLIESIFFYHNKHT